VVASADNPGAESSPTAWLSHPALRGLAALATLIAAIATTGSIIGGASPTVQVLAGAVLVAALLVVLIISWNGRGRKIGRLQAVRDQLGPQHERDLARIADLEDNLAEMIKREAGARDDWDGSEAAFQRLRSVAVGGYQTADDRDYFDGDNELLQALDERDRQLGGRRHAA
jgi:hypothetical protein